MSVPNKYAKDQTLVLDLLNTLNTLRVQGSLPTAEEIADLMRGEEHPLVRDWVQQHTNITVIELRRACRNVRIRDEIGTVPSCATDLVNALVVRDKMFCLYDGTISRTIVPYKDLSDGTRHFITVEEMKDPIVALEVRKNFPKIINRKQFARQLRLLSDRLRLQYSDRAVEDALDEWYEGSKRQRRYDIYGRMARLQRVDQREEAERVWLDVASKLFVTDQNNPPEFVAAVLKKFMHQVKRKMYGLPIYNHLMPVILGAQGTGKSTFVKKMIEPVEEIKKEVDFRQIEEDRNIEIWDYFVLFLDEMGYASKANIDTIKNAITASKLTRRPMRSNSEITFEQNATFIGCSNKELEQLIKDPTGIRRFIALMYSNRPDWNFLNGVDWQMLWTSVDAEGEDPIAPFRSMLKDAQEASREMGRVEHWMSEFRKDNNRYQASVSREGWILSNDLYGVFSGFEEEFYPGPYRTNSLEWSHEMNRIAKHQPEAMRFEKLKRTAGGRRYQFKG